MAKTTKIEKDPLFVRIMENKNIKPRYKQSIKTAINKFKKYTGETLTEYTNKHTYNETKETITKWEITLTKEMSTTTVLKYINITKAVMKKIYQPEKKKFKTRDIENDPKFQTFILKKQNITKNSKKTYITILTHFCNHTGKTITELINEQLNEQKIIIKDNTIIPYNPTTGTLNDMITEWFLELQKTHSQSTISLYQVGLRAFLKTFQIQLPPKINTTPLRPKWKLLKKEMIKNAIDMGSILDKALYSFMASTGIRGVDVRNFTIGDFMKATSEYHNSITVDDFIYNAPENMMGYWDFKPLKTLKKGIECKVFNSPESSNYILQYLKFRKSKLNLKNEKYGENYTLSRKHPLFAPYKLNTNQKYTSDGFNYGFHKTNLALKDIERNKLKNKFDNGEIDEETYEDMLDDIPSFSPHQLRKYAASVFANNGVNLRVCALFEGHKPPLATDVNYVRLDKDTLKSNYYKCLEVNIITSKERALFDKKYKELLGEINMIKNMVTVDDVNLKRGSVDDLFDF